MSIKITEGEGVVALSISSVAPVNTVLGIGNGKALNVKNVLQKKCYSKN